ncbi:MAG: hypothetical protein LBO77_01090 [Desulfovibrio sp.]|jgi:hypothetical protein|nr:hypothetical protein [Desulfovibrio sp.]
MQREQRRSVTVFLLGAFLGAATAPAAYGQGGEGVPVLADVDMVYNVCLQRCEENSVYRMALESCLETCAELRRDFPLLDKKYSSPEKCARDMAAVDLNRDLLAREAAADCSDRSLHIHKRQGCREAVAAFYESSTTEMVCSRQPFPLASAPAAPAGPVASDSVVVLPAGQRSPARQGASPPVPPLEAGSVLYDTPKYQTPEEVAKTLRRARSKAGAASKAAPKVPAVSVARDKPSASAPAAPAAARAQAAPASPLPAAAPARPDPAQSAPAGAENPPAPPDRPARVPAVSVPAAPGETVPPAAPAAAPAQAAPASPLPTAAPARPDPAQSAPAGQPTPSSAPVAASRMPLSQLLRIPSNSSASEDEQNGESAAHLLPPTPSMLKQHAPTPPTLRP